MDSQGSNVSLGGTCIPDQNVKMCRLIRIFTDHTRQLVTYAVFLAQINWKCRIGDGCVLPLVNVYVDSVVFTRIAGTS